MPSVVAGGLLLGVLAAVPAHAQEARRARPAEQPEQGLRIEPSLTAVYDDNVYRVDSGTGDPVADVIVTPAIEARYDRDRFALDQPACSRRL